MSARRRVVVAAFLLYAAMVVGGIVHAYPPLLRAHTTRDWFARAPHPEPHAPIHGPAFDATSARGAATFVYRLGPQRLGFDPTPRPDGALSVRWRRPGMNIGIHDASKSSPAVDSTGVYVGTDGGWVAALDLGGRLRWKMHVAAARRGVHATAALDGARVYVGAYNGTLYALDKRDGELAWALRLGDTIGSSAVIDGDDLYVSVETFHPPDGFVARVRRSTGDVVWLSDWLGEQSHSSPTLDRAHGLVLVGANDSSFRALDVRDGRQRWRVRTDGPVKDTACLVGDTAYFSALGGTVSAVEAATGRTRWTQRLPGKTRSSVTYVPDLERLVVGSDDGSLQALDRATGRPAWRIATGTTTMFGSALAKREPDGSWVAWAVCAPETLCAVSVADGSVRARFPLGAPFTGVPTAFGDSLYVALDAPGGLVRIGPSDR